MKKILPFLLIIFITNSYSQTFDNINANLPLLANSISVFGDIDNDGDLDLYLSGALYDGTLDGGLYIYDSGNYTLSTTSNLPLRTLGSAEFTDVDNDGDLDILIVGYDDPSGIATSDVYLNDNGVFTAMNTGIDPIFSGAATFVDVNNDNNIDIALTGMETNGWTNITKIYKNNGNNTFSELIGINLPAMNFGKIKFADYNNDGFSDFVLNGWGGPNDEPYTRIFTNNGDETFTESGVALEERWIGDVEWGDYNNDNNIDLAISGTGGASGMDRITYIYKNNGDGTFSNINANITGVSHSSLEWADFDNDGDIDLMVLGSSSTPGDGLYVYTIYNNDGGDTFSESNIDLKSSYYGDADVGDIDGDGKIDIVITGYDENDNSSSAIFMNTTVLSVTNINKLELNIYPNPTINKQTTISIDSNDKTIIDIYSISGQKIDSRIINNSSELDFSNLESGIYILKVSSNNIITSKKLIIK